MNEAEDDPNTVTIEDGWNTAGSTRMRITNVGSLGARITIRTGQHSTSGATIPLDRVAEVCALLAKMLPPLERNALAAQIEPGEF